MPAKKREGRGADLDHDQSRLELLRTVGREARPVPGSREQGAEPGEHLAAVAHAEREGVGTCEPRFELRADAGVVEDGGGPARARAEHVSVGESASRGQAPENAQRAASLHEIAHVHIHALEARAVEGGGHLQVSVHPLLAEDGDPRAGQGERRRRRRLGREGQAHPQAPLLRVPDPGEGFARRVRVVAPLLHAKARLRPPGMQRAPRQGRLRPPLTAEDDPVARDRRADDVHVLAQGVACPEVREDRVAVAARHLEHRARLFAEEAGDGVPAECGEVDVEAASAREGHLAQGGGEAAVGAVVVGEDPARLVQ